MLLGLNFQFTCMESISWTNSLCLTIFFQPCMFSSSRLLFFCLIGCIHSRFPPYFSSVACEFNFHLHGSTFYLHHSTFTCTTLLWHAPFYFYMHHSTCTCTTLLLLAPLSHRVSIDINQIWLACRLNLHFTARFKYIWLQIK